MARPRRDEKVRSVPILESDVELLKQIRDNLNLTNEFFDACYYQIIHAILKEQKVFEVKK
jgi:hypothetical protein